MGPSDHARHRHSLTHDYSGVEETRTPVLMARRATPGKSGDDHMSATAPKLVIRRPRALPAILRAGLLAGVLDITAAIVVYAHVKRTVPMLQGIASGLLGRDAFTGGLLTAGLGLLCPAVVSGEAYGVVVYFFMQVVVIPLSAFGPRPLTLATVLVGVAIHIPCVGLPIALILRRYAPSNRVADVPRAAET